MTATTQTAGGLGSELLRLLVALAWVVGATAVTLAGLGALPGWIAGESHEARIVASLEVAERSLGTGLALPSYYPSHLGWPPARIRVAGGKGGAVELTFQERSGGGDQLQLLQATTPGAPLPPAFEPAGNELGASPDHGGRPARPALAADHRGRGLAPAHLGARRPPDGAAHPRGRRGAVPDGPQRPPAGDPMTGPGTRDATSSAPGRHRAAPARLRADGHRDLLPAGGDLDRRLVLAERARRAAPGLPAGGGRDGDGPLRRGADRRPGAAAADGHPDRVTPRGRRPGPGAAGGPRGLRPVPAPGGGLPARRQRPGGGRGAARQGLGGAAVRHPAGARRCWPAGCRASPACSRTVEARSSTSWCRCATSPARWSAWPAGPSTRPGGTTRRCCATCAGARPAGPSWSTGPAPSSPPPSRGGPARRASAA